VNAAVRPRAGTYAGLFLVALSTLMYEIGLTRIFSVTMWYHFAFVAISVALLGMTAGALLVHLLPERFRAVDVDRQLWLFTLLFAVSIPICFALQLAIPFRADWDLPGIASVVAICLLVSIPFVCSGVVVCLALTRFPTHVNRLYAADLVGAALGCIALIVVLNLLSGPSTVVAIGAVAAVGAVVFAAAAGNRRWMALAGIAFVLIGGLAVANEAAADRGRRLLQIVWAKDARDEPHRHEVWNSFSRITVDGDPDEPAFPAGWGFSETLPLTPIGGQLVMKIDNAAATPLTKYTGNPDETDFLRYDITNLVHYVNADADVFVIGVGGGRDVLSAFEFDQRSVTGAEINDAILDVVNDEYGDFTGHLDRDPRVTFVNDEARSYLARSDRTFDTIQMSLIDTWAATAAGAFALAENALYTTDAFATFFDQLEPGGILSISRWYSIAGAEPLETYRTAALAAHALERRGVANPRDHLLIYHSPESAFATNTATLLISPEPFSARDIAVVERETQRLGFTPVLTPETAIDERFAALAAPGGPEAGIAQFDENIAPPTDERPFFFQMADVGTFLSGGFRNDHVTRPVLTLGMLALAVLLLTAAFVIVPLLATTRRRDHQGMTPYYLYFAGIGLGFLMIEIAQLQRLSLFLGHPIYGLAVCLFSILLFGGIGSMLAGPFVASGRAASRLAPMAALLALLAVVGLLTPAVLDRFEGSTMPVRIAASVAIMASIGLLMGMPFSIGMRAASAARPDAPTAFLWGINGAMSVCASVLATLLAILFGIKVAYWSGWWAYVLAAAALAVIVLRRPATAIDLETAAATGAAVAEPAAARAPA
jgi:hypothetical protein